MYQTLEDCPACGKENSAWPDRFCGSCEERYRREQEEWRKGEEARLKQEAAKKNGAFMKRTGESFGPYYVKRDELGEPYIARAEI